MGVGAVWYDIALVVERGCPFGLHGPPPPPYRRCSLPASNAAHRTSVPRIRTGVRTALGPRLPAVQFSSRSASLAIRSDGFVFFFMFNLIFPYRCSVCSVYYFIIFTHRSSALVWRTPFVEVRMSTFIFKLVLMDIVCCSANSNTWKYFSCRTQFILVFSKTSFIWIPSW